MDFQPSEEMQEFLKHVRKYIRTEVMPMEAELKDLNWAETEERLKPMREANKARGWWLPQIEEEHGGMGLSVTDHGLLCAELGATPLFFWASR